MDFYFKARLYQNLPNSVCRLNSFWIQNASHVSVIAIYSVKRRESGENVKCSSCYYLVMIIVLGNLKQGRSLREIFDLIIRFWVR